MGSFFSTLISRLKLDASLTARSSKGLSGLGSLPDNCLDMIFAYLEPPDICNLASVNRDFLRASSADSVWELKLPENYNTLANKMLGDYKCLAKKDIYAGLCSPIRFSGATKEVWMDKRRGGICMSISWKGMKITGIDDCRYWSHIPTLQSRFGTIAYLQQIWWLEVKGDIDFEFPAGNYSLYFRIHLGRPSSIGQSHQCCSLSTQQVHVWNIKPVRFQFSVSNDQQVTSECFLNEQGKWLSYHVGNFVVEDSYIPTKIRFSMAQIDCTHRKAGLALDCVDIQLT